MDTPRDQLARLDRAMQMRKVESYEDLARMPPKVKGGTLRQQARRARDGSHFPTAALTLCAQKLNVPASWLVFGADADPFEGQATPVPLPPPPREPEQTLEFGGEIYIAIPRWDLQFSAGPGRTAPGAPAILHQHLFRLEWLRSVTRSPTSQLAMVEIINDSMEPTLRPGDVVLMDMAQNRPGRRDGMYALNSDGELQVKRVSTHPETGLYTIASDNPAYQTWRDIRPSAVDVVGRIVWLGRRT